MATSFPKREVEPAGYLPGRRKQVKNLLVCLPGNKEIKGNLMISRFKNRHLNF